MSVEVTQADREAAAAGILRRMIFAHGFQQAWMDPATASMRMGEQDDHEEVQAFARHRQAAYTEALTFLAKAGHAIAWQAGVGGRETAGAIVSYLATSPDEIAPFFADKLSPIDFAGDWMRGGCLSWHGSDGQIWTPKSVRAAIAAKEQNHAG